MELIRAKVKGIEDVVAILGKETDGDAVVYRGASDRVFTADEVEEIGPYYERQAEDDPLGQLPTEMIQKVTEMVDTYVALADRRYWQRQRVEVTKVLLQREDLKTETPIAITELADKYIQMLKVYEERDLAGAGQQKETFSVPTN